MIFFPITEGGAKIVGVFRVKNHDFTPKVFIFPILGGGGGGRAPGAPPSGSAPVFDATFNNISVMSWRSVLLVEETGVPGENH